MTQGTFWVFSGVCPYNKNSEYWQIIKSLIVLVFSSQIWCTERENGHKTRSSWLIMEKQLKFRVATRNFESCKTKTRFLAEDTHRKREMITYLVPKCRPGYLLCIRINNRCQTFGCIGVTPSTIYIFSIAINLGVRGKKLWCHAYTPKCLAAIICWRHTQKKRNDHIFGTKV